MKDSKDQLYIERIIESIQKIQGFIGELDEDNFLQDEKTVDACLMQLINIGELANHLSSDFKEKYADLPFHKAIGMRNEIAHGYFEIEPKEVWLTCYRDLPLLKEDLNKIQ